MVLSKRLQNALNDTLILHEKQKRKGTVIPYASHPITLAMLLLEHDLEEDIIIAALLHDTIEDTILTEEALKGKYGQSVYDLVIACTEKDQSQKWEIRKQHTLDRFVSLDPKAKWIVLVDKLHNIYSMYHQYLVEGENLWQYFSRGKDKQTWYYKSLLTKFKTVEAFDNHQLLIEYEKLYMALFEGGK